MPEQKKLGHAQHLKAINHPISRWRFLLEKFGVFLTYNLLYPILMLLFALLSAVALNEPII